MFGTAQFAKGAVAAWVSEDEEACENRQRKREAEDANKVEVAPGVTVASLRRLRATLIRPTQGLCLGYSVDIMIYGSWGFVRCASAESMGKPENPEKKVLAVDAMHLGANARLLRYGGNRMARGWRYTNNNLFLTRVLILLVARLSI